MKKINHVMRISILLLSLLVVYSSCKKKSSPTIPAFTVSATPVTLNGGVAGLQFYGKCNNDDVKMTKVTITDPVGAQTVTYNLNGNYWVTNELYMLEDANTGYVKELGTWTFNFVGNRTADGTSFSVGASLPVTGK